VSPREILDARFPDALGGLVAGSTARGEETPTSDLDLIVLLVGRPAPMRSTERIKGRLVEFFVHTEASFLDFSDQEARRRRSPLLHMFAHGLIIKDHDLANETHPADRAALAAAVFTDVADLALVSRGRWSGTGRWLTRQLRDTDVDLCDNLTAGLHAAVRGDISILLSCGTAELDRVGASSAALSTAFVTRAPMAGHCGVPWKGRSRSAAAHACRASA
jgi:hypothetical protein